MAGQLTGAEREPGGVHRLRLIGDSAGALGWEKKLNGAGVGPAPGLVPLGLGRPAGSGPESKAVAGYGAGGA